MLRFRTQTMTNGTQRLTRLISLAALLGLAGTAVSGEIYKYTDDQGEVRYSDRPTGAASEQRVNISSHKTDNSAVTARVQNQQEKQSTLTDQREQQAKAADQAKAAKAAAQDQKKKCQMYRDRMETYLQSRRLYKEDEKGERVYLDEKETLAERAKVQKQIQDTCVDK